jgi:hypothetical protein
LSTIFPIIPACLSLFLPRAATSAPSSAIRLSKAFFFSNNSVASPLAFLICPISFWRRLTSRRRPSCSKFSTISDSESRSGPTSQPDKVCCEAWVTSPLAHSLCLCSFKSAITSSTSSTGAPRFLCDSRTKSGLPPLSAWTVRQRCRDWPTDPSHKCQLTVNQVDHIPLICI